MLSGLRPSRGLESGGNQDQEGKDPAAGEILHGPTEACAAVRQICAKQPWCGYPTKPSFVHDGDEHHGLSDTFVPGGRLAA